MYKKLISIFMLASLHNSLFSAATIVDEDDTGDYYMIISAKELREVKSRQEKGGIAGELDQSAIIVESENSDNASKEQLEDLPTVTIEEVVLRKEINSLQQKIRSLNSRLIKQTNQIEQSEKMSLLLKENIKTSESQRKEESDRLNNIILALKSECLHEANIRAGLEEDERINAQLVMEFKEKLSNEQAEGQKKMAQCKATIKTLEERIASLESNLISEREEAQKLREESKFKQKLEFESKLKASISSIDAIRRESQLAQEALQSQLDTEKLLVKDLKAEIAYLNESNRKKIAELQMAREKIAELQAARATATNVKTKR